MLSHGHIEIDSRSPKQPTDPFSNPRKQTRRQFKAPNKMQNERITKKFKDNSYVNQQLFNR